MPDPDDDLLRTALEQASELDRDADELAALLRSMTDIRVGMTVDTVGTGELSAYELAKAEAAKLLSWPGWSRCGSTPTSPRPCRAARSRSACWSA